MDKRGLTVDPNAEPLAPELWWNQIGETQRPSPYATEAWTYWHDWVTEEEPIKNTDDIEYELDNGEGFGNPVVGARYDSGLINQLPPIGAIVFDEGGFTQTGEPIKYIKHYYGKVKVYDSLASAPSHPIPEQRIIKEGRYVGYTALVIDPNSLEVRDNSYDFQTPIPNPSMVLDSMQYPRSGLGDVYDEAMFQITPGGDQEIVDPLQPQVPDYDFDDFPAGTLLGEINYEITGPHLTITEWSHYNWHDSQPVRKAVKVLLKEKPECVEVVAVDNDPTPFWRALGFVHTSKGSDMLVHKESLATVSPY